MKISNPITVAQLDHDELKKIKSEWDKLKFDVCKKGAKDFSMYSAAPHLYDFIEAMMINLQNPSNTTDRKLNSF